MARAICIMSNPYYFIRSQLLKIHKISVVKRLISSAINKYKIFLNKLQK